MANPSSEEDDDERREQERVPFVRRDLAVERRPIGHGQLPRRLRQLKAEVDVRDVAASGSASKNSRLMKPSMPAIKTAGKVWIPVL